MLWRYQVTGVDTVTLYFGDRIDIALVSRIQQAAEALRRRLHGRILDLVPSYTTLLIRYDLRLDDLASLTRDIADTLAELPPIRPRQPSERGDRDSGLLSSQRRAGSGRRR